jgi:DNA-binding GntR family transcriptional regulator
MLVWHKLSAGSKISEQGLAKRLGVSRTPVRESIRRLQEEGILVQVASSGTFVATPSRKQLIEMYDIRLSLERTAIAKAVRRMTAADVRRVTELTKEIHQAIRDFRDSGKPVMQGKPLQRFLEADMGVHQLIMHAAGNQTAYKVVNDVRLRQRIFGAKSHRRDLRHLARVWLLHARMERAIRQRDAKAARHWVGQHIRKSLRAALAEFDAMAVVNQRGK